MEFRHTLNTAGDGYWSTASLPVKVTRLSMPYIDDDSRFGELCVHFDTQTWDCNQHGLIYTDCRFMNELNAALVAAGFSAAAAADVTYSEQGMQDISYVSCDAGEVFIKEWKLLNEPLYRIVKQHSTVDTAAS